MRHQIREWGPSLSSTPDFKPQIYKGRGITVTGMKDSYQPGETATLTAKTDSGTKFSGWYGRNMQLLSKDSTYPFEVGGEQVLYAMDEPDTILRYSKGDTINLSEVLKTEKGTWYTAHLNGTMDGASWNTETYSDLKTGTYLVTAKTPGRRPQGDHAAGGRNGAAHLRLEVER